MAFKEGFNLRSTLAYVTDPADTQFVSSSFAYPTTANGVTFGHEGTPTEVADRDSTVDARLAGFNAATYSDTVTFRVDLASAVEHTIRLALGDLAWNQYNQEVTLYDDTTLIATITQSVVYAGEVVDATGAKRTSPADWVANNASISHTFSSTILRVRIGRSGYTERTKLIHLLVEDVAATDQIDGTSTVTISGSASISASGELAGAAPIVIGSSASLAGSGDISGQSALTITGSAIGLGSGALVGESAYTFGATGTLTSIADGSMVGTSDYIFSGTATLVGIGELDGSSVVAIGGSVTATGRGSILGASTYIFDATGTLLGVGGGSMIGESAYTIGASGQLIGSGILGGQSAVTFDSSAVLTGTGSASGVSALTFGDAGTLTGGGILAGQSALALDGSASLLGSGALLGSSAFTFGASLNPMLGIVPTAEGLEWSVQASKMHYNATGRLSYDVAGKIHYTVN